MKVSPSFAAVQEGSCATSVTVVVSSTIGSLMTSFGGTYELEEPEEPEGPPWLPPSFAEEPDVAEELEW
jgi:hypothetical protein